MSWLSSIVRATTGKSIGETVGGAIGQTFGGPVGNVAGQKIGGGITRALSDASSSQQGQSVAVDAAAEPPREQSTSGERGGYRPGIQTAVYNMPGIPSQPAMTQRMQPQQAVAGSLIPYGAAGASRLLPYLFGGAVAAAPIIIDALGQEKKLRVTRKLKTQVRNAVQVFGPEAVAEQLGTDVSVVFYILTKKMRNDGSYVTKAAVRKTRQTVRKMKHLCDMYDDLRPAAKRRAPARRSSATTLIKN
jgi:hypothetical protein